MPSFTVPVDTVPHTVAGDYGIVKRPYVPIPELVALIPENPCSGAGRQEKEGRKDIGKVY